MPSAYRVTVALPKDLSHDLDRLSKLTRRSRSAVVREWLETCAPTIRAIADVLDAAAAASADELDDITGLLDGIADQLAGQLAAVKGHPDHRRAAHGGSARAGGGEPPTSNTGVPTVQKGRN